MGGGGKSSAAASRDAAYIQSDAAIEAANIGAAASERAAQMAYQSAMAGLEVQREQFDYVTGQLQPYVRAGNKALREYSKASTIKGLDDRIGKITNTDTFSALYDERWDAASNALNQAGMTRSGAALQEAAQLSTGTALGIEDMLYGRLSNTVNLGQNAAAMQGNVSQNYANAASNIYGNLGDQQGQYTMMGADYTTGGILGSANAQATGILGAQQSKSQQKQSTMAGAASGAMIGYQMGGPWGAVAGGVIGGLGSMYYSDMRYKENVQHIGELGPLPLYQWEWKDEFKGLCGAEMGTGFMAHEVEIIYPEHVYQIGGVKTIDYPGLFDELESANG